MSDTQQIERIREALGLHAIHRYERGHHMALGERDSAEESQRSADEQRNVILAEVRALLARLEECEKKNAEMRQVLIDYVSIHEDDEGTAACKTQPHYKAALAALSVDESKEQSNG